MHNPYRASIDLITSSRLIVVAIVVEVVSPVWVPTVSQTGFLTASRIKGEALARVVVDTSRRHGHPHGHSSPNTTLPMETAMLALQNVIASSG